ncbi:MAG: hypothetical protein AAF616_15460 [Bacteroidota bacterium]
MKEHFKLSYQTQGIPAPFAFAAVVEVTFMKQDVHVNCELEYLNRDELSHEEILAEGFSGEDDLKWQGRLGEGWKDPLRKVLKVSKLPEPHANFYLHMEHQGKSYFPALNDDTIVQELIQGIFEADNREAPLKILFNQKNSTSTCIWSFASRTAQIDSHFIAWEKGHEFMRLIYQHTLDQEKTFDRPKEKSVSFDGNYWVAISNEEVWNKLKALMPSKK